MKYIDGKLFKEMLYSGMNDLGNNQARIDALNVFPVPDGDTGTNMYPVSYTHLTLPTNHDMCRSRWSPYH